jgi:hypothetical protein
VIATALRVYDSILYKHVWHKNIILINFGHMKNYLENFETWNIICEILKKIR